MTIQRRAILAATLVATAFATPSIALAQKKIVLGFSQIGAESEWRTANTESIKQAAKDAGIELKFSDAQQKQENQIKATRLAPSRRRRDVIGLSPVVESGRRPRAGWIRELMEAAAHIPAISH